MPDPDLIRRLKEANDWDVIIVLYKDKLSMLFCYVSHPVGTFWPKNQPGRGGVGIPPFLRN